MKKKAVIAAAAPVPRKPRARKEAAAPKPPAYSRAEMKRLLEAILFAADKPVPAAVLARILTGSPEAAVREALTDLGREYEELGRSFVLKEVGGGFLLLTHPAYEPWVRKLFRDRLTLRLSKSALETLAIVAYRQPVIKVDIEVIRGVNADGVLNTLLDRKLVRVVGRKEGAGRALLYGTTNEFLMYMGLNDLTELPQLEEMKAILEAQEGAPGASGVVTTTTGPAGHVEAQGPFASSATGAAATEPPPEPTVSAAEVSEEVPMDEEEPESVDGKPEEQDDAKAPGEDGAEKDGEDDEDETDEDEDEDDEDGDEDDDDEDE